jgi:hypothetical protein
MTFMDWIYKVCFFLGIVGGAALLLVVLALAVSSIF